MSNDPDMEYLSDGAAQSIIYSLSQIPQVKVISFTSVLLYKGQAINFHQAFEWLERGYQERELGPWLRVELQWDPLRDDPRFQDLLRRMNLEP